MEKILLLKHSGVLFETDHYQVFVDVISDVKDYLNTDKKVFWLVSHAHGDHYEPKVFPSGNWVNFILSDDVNANFIKNEVTYVAKNQMHLIDGLRLRTFDSTDCGVAFLVECDGKSFFHSGDLNWWHWSSATAAQQHSEAVAYKQIINQVINYKIDFACVPVDPRLESAMAWAANYFISVNLEAKVVPIHFGKSFESVENFINQLNEDERSRYLLLAPVDQS